MSPLAGDHVASAAVLPSATLKAVLEADGLTMDHVVSTSVFMKDLDEFPTMNEGYGTYFKNAPPARATVKVARLPRDVKVEIAAIAVRP
jgi:2-iminobutanoate/2-iminopropanoate deaminase